MVKYKVWLDRKGCIGCGSCVALCPDYWDLGDDGLSHIIGGKRIVENEEIVREEIILNELGCNIDAAEACPAKVIHIEEIGE
ncbi:MAG: ferredoxin [Thermoprotei archaeon]|nr:MAG: ferredoxin [Thermoprotei archaeon]